MTIDLLGFGNTDNAVTSRPSRTIIRGVTDTWAKDCSSPDADDGTSWPADIFNDLLAQMRVALRSSGIVLDNADDMLWRAMQSMGLRFGVDTGAAGALVVTYAPPVQSLYAGLPLLVQVGHDCPGATTFTPNGLATKNVTWPDISALAAADFKAGCILLLIYDGTEWQMIFKLNAGAAGSGNFVPGCIYMWPTETVPSGTLECDGSAVSRTTYARLFSAIGTRYGVGNGTSTFNIPLLQGEFPRFWDHGRSADPDAAARTLSGPSSGITGDHVGTKQAFDISFGSKTMSLILPTISYAGNFVPPYGVNPTFPLALGSPLELSTGNDPHNNGRFADGQPMGYDVGLTSTTSVGGNYDNSGAEAWGSIGGHLVNSMNGTVTLDSGGNEARPRNVYLMPIIAI